MEKMTTSAIGFDRPAPRALRTRSLAPTGLLRSTGDVRLHAFGAVTPAVTPALTSPAIALTTALPGPQLT